MAEVEQGLSILKIYTRTGDQGETSLFAGGRVDKNDLRLHAYGTVDELNSLLGLACAHQLDGELVTKVERVQMELFQVGADLATPLDADAQWIVRIDEESVQMLEQEIDALDSTLPPLKNFIIPGGSLAAATLHLARTTCRRAERWIVALKQETDINPLVLSYINRLSDWLFVIARAANARAGVADVVWQREEKT